MVLQRGQIGLPVVTVQRVDDGQRMPRRTRQIAPSVHVIWRIQTVEGLEAEFAILHALRSGCANVTSVLMDEETLLAYRDLWVPEPKAAAGTYSTLTAGEQQVLDRIRSEGNVRLEQERIPWAVALKVLVEAAMELPATAT